jgi:hypothetical protein
LTRQLIPFELLVLDTALHAVISKFIRHVNLVKPIFNVLLEETVARPSDKILRRILVTDICFAPLPQIHFLCET